MSKLPIPVKISKHSDSELFIAFSSGENVILPFTELRYQCRCAECVDEFTRARKINRASIPADIKPVRIEPVGRYAIQVEWSDGHRTGIYSYDLLLSISQHYVAERKKEEHSSCQTQIEI